MKLVPFENVPVDSVMMSRMKSKLEDMQIGIAMWGFGGFIRDVTLYKCLHTLSDSHLH